MYSMYGIDLWQLCSEVVAGNHSGISMSGLLNMIDDAGHTEELLDAYEATSTIQFIEECRFDDVLFFIKQTFSDSECTGIAALIAQAIQKNEDLSIYSDDNIVGLTIAAPWYYTEKTKHLTKDALQEVITRYINEVFPNVELDFHTFDLEG